MSTIALDPFTPERPLAVARSFVQFIHQLLEERQSPDADAMRMRLSGLSMAAAQIAAEVRYDAERLMYLAERAAVDGFPVHDQLLAIGLAHEAEIKRLGRDVLGEYKALSRKLQMPQRTASLLKDGFAAADGFQEEWLGIIRQMRHRASAIARQKVPPANVTLAVDHYAAAATELVGTANEMIMTPRIAGDMIIYEATIAVPAAMLSDAGALASLADALHGRVEQSLPHLAGCVALRFAADAHPS